MAAPTVSVVLDKASYAIGAKITATVTYSDPDAKTVTLSGTATDAEGNASPFTGSFAISDPVTLAVSDDGKRVWTKVSDTGGVAVFTATA